MTHTIDEAPSLELTPMAPAASRELAPADSTGALLSQNSPAATMLAAMSKGASPADIAQMMDLQERWERREAEKAFRDDFAAFRGENIIIPRTKFVDRGKAGSFVQAEYDQVCGRLSPALSRHGFGFRHDQRFDVKRVMVDGKENDIGWVWVVCFLEHRKGHVETLELEGPQGDATANSPVQNMQVTASYLKRQSLLAITGTATSGEDDEAAMRRRAAAVDTEDEVDADGALLDEGQTAAQKGLGDLTKWWGSLNAKQRSRLNKDFGAMRRVAQQADKEARHA